MVTVGAMFDPRCLSGFSSLFEPVTHLIDPSRRLWVPFVASAALLAWIVAMARGASALKAARSVVEPRVWLHRSARADYQLVALKALLRAATTSVTGLSAIVVAGMVISALRATVGAPAELQAPRWLVAALYTVSAFVIEDFSRFFLHWLLHKVPALWAFHRVHHSAQVLTPITLYRTHPVESLLNRARGALVIGAITGSFVWLFGASLRGWQLFSVDALGLLWTLCGANLRHSHVWLSFGPRVERWLLSPAQHQIHHSIAERHQEKNFGTVFALWDRFFGTLYTTTHRPERLRFGLRHERPSQGAIALLIEPFYWLFKRVFAQRAPSFRVLRTRAFVSGTAWLISGCVPFAEPYDRAALLQSIATCTSEVHTRFQASMDALVTASRAYEASPTEAHRDAARAAFIAALDEWQQAEMLRFGPAADRTQPGGQALRTQIYGWPEHNRCLIEEQLVTRGFEAPSFVSAPVSVRTLTAVEFLLFSTDTHNVCPPDHPINVSGAWAALSPQEIVSRRATYARIVSEQVALAAHTLVAAWSGAQGFTRTLVDAGRGSALFETQQSALNAVFNGPLYLDTDSKDLRLARPLGIANCDFDTCLDALESPYAGRSRVHIRNNLRGARRVLLGCAAGSNRGFDDLLASIGARTLSSQLVAKLDAAEIAVDAIADDSLAGPIVHDRARVIAAYNAIRELTSLLKTEFAMALALRLTRVEGDTD